MNLVRTFRDALRSERPRRAGVRHRLASALAACALAPAAAAQFTPTNPEPVPCSELLVRAWVQPETGCDELGVVDLNTQPFQSLQAAVDAVALALASAPPEAEGLVIADPGIYVARNPGEPVLQMKNRVNVRGVGARRCVIRGDGVPDDMSAPFVSGPFWPTCTPGPCDLGFPLRDILVDFTKSFPDNAVDTEEMLDGFTLQGGDVQVYAPSIGYKQADPIRGRISNCIFDMRHDDEGVAGPYFGILMAHAFVGDVGDVDDGKYWDVKLNVLSNTFVMGEPVGYLDQYGLLSRPEAVAICDVNIPCPDPAFFDSDLTLRGVGNPSIQNNLIRSLPGQTGLIELLGIDASDVEVVRATSSPLPTNAFHSQRVGGTNGVFCSADTLGMGVNPAVDLANQDPGFVGDSLRRGPSIHFHLNWDPTVPGTFYGGPQFADWRLMFDSPVVNQGQFLEGGELEAVNGTLYSTPCDELHSYTWDADGYGNPRVYSETIDIGADETHMAMMVGNWGPNDYSHNSPSALNLGAGQGRALRWVFIDPTFAGGLEVDIVGPTAPPIFLPSTPSVPLTSTCPNGYAVHPGFMTQRGVNVPPRFDPALPFDHRFAYVPLGGSGYQLLWTGTTSAVLFNLTNGVYPGQVHQFRMFDNSGPESLYFVDSGDTGAGALRSSQVLIDVDPDPSTSVRWRGSLQQEYY
jgi:hypothetical protein